MATTYIADRRQTGDTSMRCDAHDNGARCDATEQLTDIGGDAFVGSGTRFVVKHRLCERHRALYARTHFTIERC